MNDYGTQEEDGPGTWEALPLLHEGQPEYGSRRPNPTEARQLAHATPGEEEAQAVKEGPSKGNRSEGRRNAGSRRATYERRRRGTDCSRTRPSKGGPCRCELQEGTMTDASTSEDMSPRLMKVVERAQREPEGRFHSLAHLMDVPALERAYRRIAPVKT